MIVLFLLTVGQLNTSLAEKPGIGEFPPFTEWYQNPLGVSPISLHTGNGIIIPAIAATAVLIFTDYDSTLSEKLTLYNNFGATYGYYASETSVYQNNIGFHYKLRSYMSVGADFSTVKVSDDVNNTYGFGIRPYVRFYPYSCETIDVFFQSGAGLTYFLDNFPKPSGFFGDNREGTQLNGSPMYGAGCDIRLSNKYKLNLGLWHVHFSNGDHPGYERNPGHDSNGFTIGISYIK